MTHATALDRRTFVLAAGAIVGAAAAPSRSDEAQAVVRRAMRQLGPTARLNRVQILSWTGDAEVYLGDKVIELRVSTEIVPFSWARSSSWLRSKGPETARTMVITPTAGWGERGGKSEPLPERMVVHERYQYAVYGMMLLAPLLRPPARVELLPSEQGLTVIAAEHPAARPAKLFFDRNSRLVQLTNSVPSSEDDTTVDQVFRFSEESVDGALRWPRELSIEHGGRPYFRLRIKEFAAR